MKQIIKLHLNGNLVEADTTIIYNAESEFSFDSDFSTRDINLKVVGVEDGKLKIQCVSFLTNPTTIQFVYIPIAFDKPLEQVVYEQAQRIGALEEEVKEMQQTIAILTDNLES